MILVPNMPDRIFGLWTIVTLNDILAGVFCKIMVKTYDSQYFVSESFFFFFFLLTDFFYSHSPLWEN